MIFHFHRLIFSLEVRFHDALFIRKRRSSLNQIDSREGGSGGGGGDTSGYISCSQRFQRTLKNRSTVNTCIYSARLKRNSISLHLRPGFSLPFNFLLRKCYDWGPFSFYRGDDECTNACRFLRAVGAGMRWKREKERENERLILTLIIIICEDKRVGRVHSFFFKWNKSLFKENENDM